eukprot:9497735-Prorocentrum_lima.AAC.1
MSQTRSKAFWETAEPLCWQTEQQDEALPESCLQPQPDPNRAPSRRYQTDTPSEGRQQEDDPETATEVWEEWQGEDGGQRCKGAEHG